MVLDEDAHHVGVDSERASLGHAHHLANRRRRSELASTDTLDSDIAALARTGESSQPVHG